MTRSRRLAILLTLVGAGLLLLAATRQWAGVHLEGVPGVSWLTVSGRQAAPAAIPVALAAAAGAIVLATSGRIVRLLVGVGLAIGGLAAIVVGVRGSRDESGALASALRTSLGLVSHRADPAAFGASYLGASVQITFWPWTAAVGGLLIAAGGLVTVLRGWSWPAPGRRFERSTGPSPSGPPGAVVQPVPQAMTAPQGGGSSGTWDALSRGEDPTSMGDDPT